MRIILKENVSLVHVNNGMSNLESIIAAVLLKRKVVVHFHGPGEPGLAQRLMFNRVHKYITISQHLHSSLINSGFPEDNMITILNPVHKTHALSDNSPGLRSHYGLNSGDKVFAIVGRILRWKGHVEFLNAAFLVLKNMPNAKALIVGDFADGDINYQKKIQSMINKSGFGNRIIMTGYIKDAGKIYSIMDVCVHTSIEPEPFGLVILEAMLNAVPMIAANTGAPKEIITDKINGYIVDPHNPAELSDTILTLLGNTQLRLNIGNKGREYVQKNHRTTDFAHSIEQVYDTALK